MAVLARGSITDRPWGMTMGALGTRGLSGQLTVLAEGKQYRVAFSEGAVVGAHSPLATDAAVRLALTGNLITSTQVSELMRRMAAAPNRDEVDVLAELCRLAPDQAQKLRRRLVAQRAARTFSLEAGEFVVEDRVNVPVAPGSELDVRAVIYLGARNNLGEARLSRELEQLGVWFKLKQEAIEDLPQYGFTENEKPVLRMLLEGAYVADIEAAHPNLGDRAVRSVAYALAVCGACEASALPKRPTAPPRPAARPESGQVPRLDPAPPIAAMPRTSTEKSNPPPPTVTRSGASLPPRTTTPQAIPIVQPRPATPTPGSRSTSPSHGVPRSAPAGSRTSPSQGVPRPGSSTAAPRPGTPTPGTQPIPRPQPSRTTSATARPPHPTQGLEARTTGEPRPGSVPPGTALPRTSTEPRPASVPPGTAVPRTSTGPARPPSVPLGTSVPRTTTARTPTGPRPASGSNVPTPSSSRSMRHTRPTQTRTRPPSNQTDAPTERSRPYAISPARRAKRDTAATLEIEQLLASKLPMLDRGVDYFTLLGLTETASAGDVRSTYFALARKLHPDRLSAIGINDDDRQAQRLMAQINAAFQVLNDPVKREEYASIVRRGGTAAVRDEEAKADELAMRVMRAEEAFKQGEMALRREKMTEAVASFSQAVELQPNEPEYQALLAWSKFAAASDKASVASLTRRALTHAAEANDNSATARFYLGRVERMLGREKEALYNFYEVLRIKPNHSEAQSEARILEQRLKARR